LVEEKEILDRVVGYKKVHPAIVVDIRGNDSPGFA
jgi:hypothetical protein